MKKKRYRLLRMMFVVLAFCTLAFTGCGTNGSTETKLQTEEDGGIQNQESESDIVSGKETEEETEEETKGDDAIYVSTSKELLEAVKPGAEIVLEPGTYNFSEFLMSKDAFEPGADKRYFTVSDSDDSCYISIQEVEDVVLRGREGECPTITVDAGTAMEFFNCNNITLENLCVRGPGDDASWGSLLEFTNCKDVAIDNVQLKDSSAYGIYSCQVSNLLVKDSVIETCGAGMSQVMFGDNVSFENCVIQNCGASYPVEREVSCVVDVYASTMKIKQCEFTGNGKNSGVICGKPLSMLQFESCHFGQEETSKIAEECYAYGNVTFDEGCRFDGALSRQIEVVSTPEELLSAIRPNTTVFVKPGKYNLSEYMEALWPAGEEESWGNPFDYVYPDACYDGVELTVKADGLAVIGMSDACNDTEIVVSPRYANVFTFDECDGVCVANLTLGHTEQGDCSGNVLGFRECSGVVLSNLDIYGCGYYGIDVFNDQEGTDYYVFDSVIRDCSAGPFSIVNIGSFTFQNCVMENSDGAGFFSNEYGTLFFNRCSFGTSETNYWYFNEDAAFSDCHWEEITEYPDVEPEEGDAFDYDCLIPVDSNEVEVADTYYAYMSVNQQSGETLYYPGITLYLAEDGTGYYKTEEEQFDFTWNRETDGTITLKSEIYRYLNLYKEPQDGFDVLWIMMQMDEKVVWFY